MLIFPEWFFKGIGNLQYYIVNMSHKKATSKGGFLRKFSLRITFFRELRYPAMPYLYGLREQLPRRVADAFGAPSRSPRA